MLKKENIKVFVQGDIGLLNVIRELIKEPSSIYSAKVNTGGCETTDNKYGIEYKITMHGVKWEKEYPEKAGFIEQKLED